MRYDVHRCCVQCVAGARDILVRRCAAAARDILVRRCAAAARDILVRRCAAAARDILVRRCAPAAGALCAAALPPPASRAWPRVRQKRCLFVCDSRDTRHDGIAQCCGTAVEYMATGARARTVAAWVTVAAGRCSTRHGLSRAPARVEPRGFSRAPRTAPPRSAGRA